MMNRTQLMRMSCLSLLSLILSSCGDGRIGPLSPKFEAYYRDSMVGLGKVIILHNPTVNYYRDVSIKVTAQDGTSTIKPVAEVIKPHESIEIGWLQLGDWIIEPGETIYIYVKGYAAPYICSVRE